MSHIYRLYTGGSETYQGWFGSSAFPYNFTARGTIKDPNGATVRHEITSIPSPFARMDLIKNAFRVVCDKRDLDGKTIFHKMISDTLDIGELFFNNNKLKDKLQIITWNPKTEIPNLKNSPDAGQKALGDALAKYMVADGNTYNFNHLQNIYLLNYVNGPDELNIIGATSPATLFFSNANDLSYVSEDISFGQDKPFDNEYQPLYKRDFEYIKIWFVLRSTIPNFANLFPEIDDYLSLTFQRIADDSMRNELRNVTATDAGSYNQIAATIGNQVNQVEVLGFPLYEKTVKIDQIKSEFQIKPTTGFNGKLLVLPVEKGNRYSNLKYVTDVWGTENAVPYYDEKTLNNRTLPFDGTSMSYLTISDLLEDTLIKVPHTLNNERFFDGNMQIEKPKLSYLIPIKSVLFDYFSINDLMGKLADGHNMLDMQLLAGDSVKVTLRIPITGNQQVNYIEYSRIYYNNRPADISKNEGGIKNLTFMGLIMPLIKFNNESDAIYRVVKIVNVAYQCKFEFCTGSLQVANISQVKRKVDDVNNIDIYAIEGQNFDYIKIRTGQYSNLLIPKFLPQKDNKVFDFSIDIGTSNTHIEYKDRESNRSKAFGYDKADVLMTTIFRPTYIVDKGKKYIDDLKDEMSLIDRLFLPELVSEKGDYSFPIKTVLASAQNIDWQRKNLPFELTNIPFTYNKRVDLPETNYNTDIKWGKDAYLMESYIDNILFLIRNKVLQDNGDLSQTTIKWFYPLSMPRKRKTRLEECWNKAYQRYFPCNGNTLEMSESYAPILYYFNKYSTATRLVNIDIGGGTTDIAYAIGEHLRFVTSFRFAANTLFEDSLAPKNLKNGLVDFGCEEIRTKIPDSLSEILKIFDKRSNGSTGTADMASFLFSLSNNSQLKKEKINPETVDFNRLLQDNDDFRIVFIMFYTAIIYHIAQIIKVLDLEVPRHVSFAGNGSRVVNIITPDSNLLSQYTKVIFEEVLEKPYKEELEIIGLNDSILAKETTCKGGLCSDKDSGDKDDIVIMSSLGDRLLTSDDTYDILTDNYKDKIISSVETFFGTFFKLNKNFDFDENFGVKKSSVDIAHEICCKDLRTFLDKGINLNQTEHALTDKIEEPLFFYPIKGVLNILSQEIYNNIKK